MLVPVLLFLAIFVGTHQPQQAQQEVVAQFEQEPMVTQMTREDLPGVASSVEETPTIASKPEFVQIGAVSAEATGDPEIIQPEVLVKALPKPVVQGVGKKIKATIAKVSVAGVPQVLTGKFENATSAISNGKPVYAYVDHDVFYRWVSFDPTQPILCKFAGVGLNTNICVNEQSLTWVPTIKVCYWNNWKEESNNLLPVSCEMIKKSDFNPLMKTASDKDIAEGGWACSMDEKIKTSCVPKNFIKSQIDTIMVAYYSSGHLAIGGGTPSDYRTIPKARFNPYGRTSDPDEPWACIKGDGSSDGKSICVATRLTE